MNNKEHAAALLIVSVITSGCAPLQQAPLVYSSKVVVGVDVSMSVAENQGGSVNIGVKSVDSAYVPVAVSKQVDERAKQDGNSVEIKIIEAKFGEGTTSDKQDDAGASERNRKIEEYFSTKQAVNTATEVLNVAEKRIKDISALIGRVETIRAGIIAAQNMTDVPPGTQRSDAFQNSTAEVDKLNQESRLNFSAVQPDQVGVVRGAKVVGEIDAWLRQAKSEKTAAEGALQPFKLDLQTKSELAGRAKAEAMRVVGLSKTDKTDAMSVYGRFDSTGTGDAKGGAASLLVGKVFSTGLASQNLTEAVKISAKNSCVSNAFSLAQTMTVETDRNAFIATIDRMCGYARQ
jgi:hypothetical protein